MRIKDLTRELMALTSPRTLQALLFVPPRERVSDRLDAHDDHLVRAGDACATNRVSEG